MDCKATSTTDRRCSRRQAGATLVETVMAIGIGVLVLGVLMTFAMYQGRSFSVLTNMIDLDQANRVALDYMTRDIRQVNRMTSFGTNSVTLEDYDGLPLRYTYDKTNRTVNRTKLGQTTVLLHECDSVGFSMMQRNIVEGSYAYYPADDVTTCKVVGITWTCSRKILGKISNVSGVQSARIVIRKQ